MTNAAIIEVWYKNVTHWIATLERYQHGSAEDKTKLVLTSFKSTYAEPAEA